MRPAPFQTTLGEVGGGITRKTVPFDYAFRFELTGQPDNVLKNVVTVSVEATYVAVAIGYGVIPRLSPIRFGFQPDFFGQFPTLREITLGDVIDALDDSQSAEALRFLREETGPEAALKNGLKLNPELAERALLGVPDDNPSAILEPSLLANLFQVVGTPPGQIQFLYALFDDGSGREFQNTPILNTAGLGTADGDRPFRYFAQPISFAPRSTIRMEVTEKSDFRGELHVTLIGYKALGEAGTPTARIRQSLRRPR
ncbi:MAG: hypothetical protein HUU32_05945 [Calditrichaceae bacterium]|nr:hypothetical protein [Calditrichia bacterium]NUQ40919.1 hypothetical protein [Calditrichaceae bacterium]